MTSQSRDLDRESRFTSLYEATYADLLRFAQRRVAASRARDQVWVFHSVRPENLSGGDFRRRYLEYLAEPVVDHVDPALGEVLPDVPHPAFESVFEQRTYLAITARGYRVRPQYPAGRYRIDLVVQGGSSRLAVECDGDAYHDADAEADDILRQRELERLGWRFWRVRGSQFFRDPDASLAGLWGLLDSLGIEPEAATTRVTVHDEVVVPDLDGSVSGGPAADDADDAAVSADTQAAPPVTVPAGAIVMGPASRTRLQQEAEILDEEFRREHDTAAAGDARVRASVSREWGKRKERLVARLQHVRSDLDRSFVVPVSQLGDEAWPGAVIQYRDETTGDVYDAVVSEVDLADETYERVSPNSPLGKLLTGARAGQRLSYTKPNGEPVVMEIVAVTD